MAQMQLIQNGKTNWRIVTPVSPSATERNAAREFATFFAKITGVTLPIVDESAPAQAGEVLINTVNRDFEAKQAFAAAELGEEGYFYALEEENLFIGAKGARGILYGVYSFLEDALGCRWFTETLEVVPQNDTIILETGVQSFVPPMHYRATSYLDGTEAMYCVRNKLNARTEIGPEFGGSVDFAIGYVHTLQTLIPEELFEEHPEYFPEIDGKREKGDHLFQRCLTNPDVLQLTIEKVREEFRANPDMKIASVSQADTYPDYPNVCTCERCRAINEEEGSLMGTQLRYVNAVADAIAEEFPDRYIETLAYRFTRQRPKITRPRKNVIIRLCSIECCFSHPIEQCGHDGHNDGAGHVSNPAFIADMEDWAEISDNIYIWDYVANFPHYLVPHPNLHVFGSNMKFFVNHKTVGMFPEGAYDDRGAEMSELKSWILAKLEWDPDFDVEKGTREFISAYCGAAAEPVLRYITELNQRAEDIQSHRTCFTGPDTDFFSPEFMTFSKACFDEAKEKADSKEVLERILRWEMSIRYVDLVLYHEKYTDEQLREQNEAFFADMEKFGIGKFHEGATMEMNRQRLINEFQGGRV